MQTGRLFVLIHIRNKGKVGTICCRDVPDNGYGKQNNKKLR